MAKTQKDKRNGLPKVVEVYWQDATSVSEWMTPEQALQETPVDCHTVGYLLYKSKSLLRVVRTVYNDCSRVGDVFLIPTAWITRIRYLK